MLAGRCSFQRGKKRQFLRVSLSCLSPAGAASGLGGEWAVKPQDCGGCGAKGALLGAARLSPAARVQPGVGVRALTRSSLFSTSPGAPGAACATPVPGKG